MKELGQARHILGMRIERNQTTKTLRLHVKGVEALQHEECEANTNTASDILSIIRKRLSIHRGGEIAHESNTLRVGHRKSHVRDGGDPTRPCLCRRGHRPIHVKTRMEALGSCEEHILVPSR